MVEKEKGKIRWVYKHFPLGGNPRSKEISEVSACGSKMGNEGFWMVHDFLFTAEAKSLLTTGGTARLREKISAMAKEKGMDADKFSACMDQGEGKRQMEADQALGYQIPVTGTPAFVINGSVYKGMPGPQVWENHLRKAKGGS